MSSRAKRPPSGKSKLTDSLDPERCSELRHFPTLRNALLWCESGVLPPPWSFGDEYSQARIGGAKGFYRHHTLCALAFEDRRLVLTVTALYHAYLVSAITLPENIQLHSWHLSSMNEERMAWLADVFNAATHENILCFVSRSTRGQPPLQQRNVRSVYPKLCWLAGVQPQMDDARLERWLSAAKKLADQTGNNP